MRAPSPRANPALLGLFWLGIQMVWGAVLAVSLQARASQLQHGRALAAYGALAIAGASVAAVTQLVVGVLSDRRRARGSRRIEFYAGGAIAAAFALLGFYLAPGFGQLVAATIALQIAMNVAIGPYQAVIPDFISDERVGTASSWMAALQSVGNAAGAICAGLIASARTVAFTLAAALIATCAVTVAHVRRLSLVPVQPQALRITRPFVDLFISRAFVWVGFYTLVGYLYFYVARAMSGDTQRMTAIVLLIFTIAGAAGAAAAAVPANRMDRRAVATFGGAGFMLGIAAFLSSHAAAAISVSAVIAGVAWGIFLTADWALGCRFLPRNALAVAMGIWNLALLIPQIAAPLVATGILTALRALQSASAPRIAFVLAGIEVALGIMWIWRLPAYSASVETVRAGNTP
jgi:MFS family permease